MVALSRVAEPIYRAYLGVSQRAGSAHADNCSIVPDGLQSLKSSEIAAGRTRETLGNPKRALWELNH
jgi:hypothetical protein